MGEICILKKSTCLAIPQRAETILLCFVASFSLRRPLSPLLHRLLERSPFSPADRSDKRLPRVRKGVRVFPGSRRKEKWMLSERSRRLSLRKLCLSSAGGWVGEVRPAPDPGFVFSAERSGSVEHMASPPPSAPDYANTAEGRERKRLIHGLVLDRLLSAGVSN